jgi:FkbM family methyltransferase
MRARKAIIDGAAVRAVSLLSLDSPRVSAPDDFAFMIWRVGRRADNEEYRRETGWRQENLRKPELAPKTVIDVGVARGTPNLYDAFPEAHFVLIEPLREFEEDLKRISRRRGGEYVLAAVGAAPGRAEINVNPAMLYESSMLVNEWRPREEHEALERREVEVTTLDLLRAERGWAGPFGLKIDAEGYEHQVIEGAAELLRETQFVIAEVSITRPFSGGASFAEFIALMDRLGFAVHDLLDGLKRGNGGVEFVDVMFCRT